MSKLTVGLIYNMMPSSIDEKTREYYLTNFEWDSDTTIMRLMEALEKTGSRVIGINAVRKKEGKVVSYDAFHELEKYEDELDIVFNFAEGASTKNRECLIPSFLEWLNIPHTGSDLTTLAIGMDKATTHEVLSYYGINSPPHLVVNNPEDMRALKRYAEKVAWIFPGIVKPLGAGTSIGVGQSSVVHNINELEEMVNSIIKDYKQPVLIEDFLAGKEYGVGILGNLVLPIIEFDLEKVEGSPKVRDPFVKEVDHSHYSRPLGFGNDYAFMAAQAAIVHTALGCNDYSRSDFRTSDGDGKNYFIEINSLPGLDPKLSDYTSICEFAGIDYDTMINAILWEAIKRYRENPEFAERFSEGRTGYINEFIRPVMDSLDVYPVSVPSGMKLPPEITSVPYHLVRAKQQNGQK